MPIPKPQINARLSHKDREHFELYASKFMLDAAELARLLIVREMTVRRILRMKWSKLSPKESSPGKNHRKLTAHFHTAKIVSEFDEYAKKYGLSRAAAAKIIFETELTEKWLLKAIKQSPRKRGPHTST